MVTGVVGQRLALVQPLVDGELVPELVYVTILRQKVEERRVKGLEQKLLLVY